MRKKFFVIFIFILLIFMISVVYFGMNLDHKIGNTVFFELLTAFTALFGVASIVFQSNRSKDLDEAKFIFDLNKQYISNKRYQTLLDLLSSNVSKTFPEDIEELISSYFDFFEPIYILIKKDILKLELIDDLFCFRFFSVVNHPFVQDMVLTKHKEYYANIVKLHFVWKKYRLKKKKDNNIPLLNSDLSLVEWYNNFLYSKKRLKCKETFQGQNIKIREASIKDTKSIVKLYIQLLGNYDVFTESNEQIMSTEKGKNNKIFVATIGTKVVGTIQCSIIPSIAFNGRPNLCIDYFVVDKNYHYMGIEKLLFKRVEEISQKNNVKSNFLAPTKFFKEYKFLKKFGFSTYTRGYKIDKR